MLSGTVISVSTATPSLLCAADNESVVVVVHNDSQSANDHIYVGNATVGTNAGLLLHEKDFVQLTLPAGDSLYGLANKTGITASVLRIWNP